MTTLRAFDRPRLWLAMAWVLVAAIVLLSLLPPAQLRQISVPNWNDKLGHFIAYFALSAWYAQLYGSGRAMARQLVFCLLLGLAMEGLQSLTVSRTADWRDMVANAAGVFAGGSTWFTALAGVLQRWDRSRRSRARL